MGAKTEIVKTLKSVDDIITPIVFLINNYSFVRANDVPESFLVKNNCQNALELAGSYEGWIFESLKVI